MNADFAEQKKTKTIDRQIQPLCSKQIQSYALYRNLHFWEISGQMLHSQPKHIKSHIDIHMLYYNVQEIWANAHKTHESL